MTTGRLDDEFSKRAIARHCEAALASADALGVFPTPIDDVLHAAGAAEVIDIGDIPAEIERAKPKLLQRLLGAVLYRQTTVFVDLQQRNGRVLWTKSHEAAHLVLPWHEAAAHLDDNTRLFGDSAEALETEANYGAAHLVFQGDRAMDKALQYQHGLNVPIMLSDVTGASIHASIRYYVEHHPDPMALATTGRRRTRTALPIYLLTRSPSWTHQFGSPAAMFGNRRLNIESGAFATALQNPSDTDGIQVLHTRARDLRGDRRPVSLEVFDNGYNKFFLIRTRNRIELGRRVKALAHPA